VHAQLWVQFAKMSVVAWGAKCRRLGALPRGQFDPIDVPALNTTVDAVTHERRRLGPDQLGLAALAVRTLDCLRIPARERAIVWALWHVNAMACRNEDCRCAS
jgi:hypothetical protein